MKLKSEITDNMFCMPKKVIDYLKGAKKTETKLIMYIFSRNGEEFSVEDAAKSLSETTDSIASALAFWRGTGIISEVEEDESEPQQKELDREEKDIETKAVPVKNQGYSTEEVADAMQSDGEFKALVNYAEHTLGVLLNSSRVSTLLYLYDSLGMQTDVIMGIIAHCVSNGKKSLRYIEKCAEGIHNDGVVTYKELESYLAAKRRYAEYETMVKRVIGASDRALTPKEAKLVAVWENTYKASKELVEYAYEKTVSAISKPSVSYMSKILETWYSEGLDTVEKVDASTEKKKDESVGTKTSSSFDFDLSDIFEKP